jgi:hypothetical protein
MLFILISILILLPVLAGFGEFFRKAFGEIWEGVSGKIFSGIFLLAMIWQIMAFFFPLNAWVEGVSLTAGISSFFYFKTSEI